MNKGKICVPVCARTADEMLGQIKRAAELADVIELRFDCLDEKELDKAISLVAELECEKPFLATFRPKEQGGFRELTMAQRLKFWEGFLWKDKGRNFYCDIEHDLDLKLNFGIANQIVSYHDFNASNYNADAQFDLMTRLSDAKIFKLAFQVDRITSASDVWKLIEKAKSRSLNIIPIAMGEAGKWTRILGLAHGAYMTYAALDEESGTAPGQITAKDMHDVYRVKELNKDTKVYGIVGGNTSYSRSPYIHNAAFKAAGLNAVYIPLQVANLEEFMRRMVLPATREVELNFHGFSVTIPHKQAIMQFLDEIDETAKAIGAVNTVKIEDGKLYGYNTDAEGFIRPLLNSYGDISNAKVALLGAGGAARACVYALKKAGVDVTIFARNLEKAKTLADEFGIAFDQLPVTNNQLLKFDILVNSTPVGMKGKFEGQSPLDSEALKGLKLVYDLVYTPEKTKLLLDAENLGIKTLGGMEMLLEQAMIQQFIWTGNTVSKESLKIAVKRI